MMRRRRKNKLEYIVGSQFMHLKARYAYMLVLLGSTFEFSLPQMQCLTCHYITTNLSLYETHRTSSLSRSPTQCLLLNCECVRVSERSLALVCYNSVNWWSSVIAFIRMFEFCLQQTFHRHWLSKIIVAVLPCNALSWVKIRTFVMFQEFKLQGCPRLQSSFDLQILRLFTIGRLAGCFNI